MDPWSLLASHPNHGPVSSFQGDPCQDTKSMTAQGLHVRLSSGFHMHTYVNTTHEQYMHAHRLFRTVDILESK